MKKVKCSDSEFQQLTMNDGMTCPKVEGGDAFQVGVQFPGRYPVVLAEGATVRRAIKCL